MQPVTNALIGDDVNYSFAVSVIRTNLTGVHCIAVTRARIEFDSPGKMIQCLEALARDSAAGIILVLRVKSLGLSSGSRAAKSHATAGFRVISHVFRVISHVFLVILHVHSL